MNQSERQQVYIFPTRHAAALFLHDNAHLYSDFKNIYFNTDPAPTIAFPLSRENFLSLHDAHLALARGASSVQPVQPVNRVKGLSPEELEALFKGGPPPHGVGPRAPFALATAVPGPGPAEAPLRLRLGEGRAFHALSEASKKKVEEVTTAILASSINHERYINQGWYYNTNDNVWSIPLSRYDSFVELENAVNEGRILYPEEHSIPAPDIALIHQIVRGIHISPAAESGIITEEATQEIIGQTALHLRSEGTPKWGDACMASLSIDEQSRLRGQITRITEALRIQQRALAQPLDPIQRQPIEVNIQILTAELELKNELFRKSAAQRARTADIKEIDAKIKTLASKIQRASRQISVREKRILRALSYAERVQECADAFHFDIAEFRLDIDELGIRVASLMIPNCGTESNRAIGTIAAQHLATLKLCSLLILEPNVQELKRINIDKLNKDLDKLAISNYRHALYNTNTGPLALMRRGWRGVRQTIGNVLSAASEAPEGNFMGIRHLTGQGTRKVGRAASSALGSVSKAVFNYFPSTRGSSENFGNSSASASALNSRLKKAGHPIRQRPQGGPAPLREGNDLLRMEMPAPLREGNDLLRLGGPPLRRSNLFRMHGLDELASGGGGGFMPEPLREGNLLRLGGPSPDDLASGWGAGGWQEGLLPSSLPAWRPDGSAGSSFAPVALTVEANSRSRPSAPPGGVPEAAFAGPNGFASANSREHGLLLGALRNGPAMSRNARRPNRGQEFTKLREALAENVRRQAENVRRQTEKRKATGLALANKVGMLHGKARLKTRKERNVAGKNKSPRQPRPPP